MELYRKHRPKSLRLVEGQARAISMLNKMVEKGNIPHALLFTGPSGTGKTTLARILARGPLQCSERDFIEINTADLRGVDDIRAIRKRIDLSPMMGSSRVWCIDEAHKMTNDAQNALLKMLEDPPKHAYFVLCTTDPQKLIKTIHGRCTEVKLNPIDADSLHVVLTRVCTDEKLKVSRDVLEEIIAAAEGSARKALVILEQVGSLDPKEQAAAIANTTFTKDGARDLSRLLINTRTTWHDVAKLLRVLKDEEPESIRYAVLGYMRMCLLGSDEKAPNMNTAPRAWMVIDIFSKNFYDSKHAGLAAACWEVCNPGR